MSGDKKVGIIDGDSSNEFDAGITFPRLFGRENFSLPFWKCVALYNIYYGTNKEGVNEFVLSRPISWAENRCLEIIMDTEFGHELPIDFRFHTATSLGLNIGYSTAPYQTRSLQPGECLEESTLNLLMESCNAAVGLRFTWDAVPFLFFECLSRFSISERLILSRQTDLRMFFMTVNDANEWLSVDVNFHTLNLLVYGAGSISPALEHQLDSEIVAILRNYKIMNQKSGWSLEHDFKVSYVANQLISDNNCGVLAFCWILHRAFYSWNSDIFEAQEADSYRRLLRLNITLTNDLFVYQLYKQLCYVYGEGYCDADTLPATTPPSCLCSHRGHTPSCCLGTDLITLPEISFLAQFGKSLSSKKRDLSYVKFI